MVHITYKVPTLLTTLTVASELDQFLWSFQPDPKEEKTTTVLGGLFNRTKYMWSIIKSNETATKTL